MDHLGRGGFARSRSTIQEEEAAYRLGNLRSLGKATV
jgi:hypothetical protein